jgi:hypothetical protein
VDARAAVHPRRDPAWPASARRWSLGHYLLPFTETTLGRWNLREMAEAARQMWKLADALEEEQQGGRRRLSFTR